MPHRSPRIHRGIAAGVLISAVALSGCSGDGDPSPTGTAAPSSAALTASGSPSPETTTLAWDATPVWEGEATLHNVRGARATFRLYPLQRIDGRVLLTVEMTPQGTPGEVSDFYSPFCYFSACNRMSDVSLIDTSAMRLIEPLHRAGSDAVYGSVERSLTKVAGSTYRYGVFFPDPGTPTVGVNLVNGGTVPVVPIVDGGVTAPELVLPAGSGSESRPAPSVVSGPSGSPTLVTFPVQTPPGDARAVIVPLTAPVLGGEITSYLGTVSLNADVLFAFNKATLSPAAKSIVAQAVTSLTDKADPKKPVLVVGHTDNVGGTAFNTTLSTRRADAVVAALRTALPALDYRALGKGESEPAVPNTSASGKDDPEGRALNRRVEIRYTPKPVATPTPTSTQPVPAATATATNEPQAVATLGPADIGDTAADHLATAQIAPVTRVGAMAVVRFTLTTATDFGINFSFSGQGNGTAPVRIRFTDPSTKTTYLIARQATPERPVGTYSGFTAKAGAPYRYFIYTAAPPEGVTSVVLDLGPLGKTTVPVQ